MWARDTSVFVTVVPMLAPMIIGTALAIGSAFSGAATSPTISEVETEELWTRVVARIPTMRPMNGFSVACEEGVQQSASQGLERVPQAVDAQEEDEQQRQHGEDAREWAIHYRAYGSRTEPLVRIQG